MRTAQIMIGDKLYWLCNNLAANISIDELPVMASMTKKILAVIKILLDNGYLWAKKQGKTANEPPTLEELAENCGDEDLERWMPVVQRVRRGERNVEAQPSKKDEAEQSAE